MERQKKNLVNLQLNWKYHGFSLRNFFLPSTVHCKVLEIMTNPGERTLLELRFWSLNVIFIYKEPELLG